MRMLDDLSGFEFEDTMGVVFQKLGYEDVQVMVRVADEGRDIVMTEPNPDGDNTTIIVECKHTESVSRPVIQKLDSATSTYEHDGPKKGMIVTTGRLTAPAKEYAERVDIEVIDGQEIREIADEVGMDVYNGRIEIICEEVLDPSHPNGPGGPIYDEITDIQNLSPDGLPDPDTFLTLVPSVLAQLRVQSTFSTTVGVVHRIDERYVEVLDASRDGPSRFPSGVGSLVRRNIDKAVDLDEEALSKAHDSMNRRRFGVTETEYRDLFTQQAIERCTETVTYTGDNNVAYEKVCEPSESDVQVEWFSSVYTPRIRGSTRIGDQEYEMDWFIATQETVVTADSFHECRVCSDGGAWSGLRDLAGIYGVVSREVMGDTYTFCENCGRIACQAHIRTERLTGDPVCTGCAVTDRFAGGQKYFFEDHNKEQFSDEYADMGLFQKISENGTGIVVWTVVVFLLILLLL